MSNFSKTSSTVREVECKRLSRLPNQVSTSLPSIRANLTALSRTLIQMRDLLLFFLTISSLLSPSSHYQQNGETFAR